MTAGRTTGRSAVARGLDADGLRGPQPLACPAARQQVLRLPAQGVFQGAWAALGAAAAGRLADDRGLDSAGVVTLRLDCANGSFDLHRTRDGRLLTALDGHVLALRVRPDPADAQTPVRELLLQHLSELGTPLDAARIERLQPWLAASLGESLRRWLARPARPDLAPRLDGDPFTGAQEPPLALALGSLRLHGAQATQELWVDLGGQRRQRLVYQLRRADGGAWQVTDIDLGQGTLVRQLIRSDLSRSDLSGAAPPAAAAAVSTPAPGSPERPAILNVVRGELGLALDGRSRFKVSALRADDGVGGRVDDEGRAWRRPGLVDGLGAGPAA